MTAQDLKNSILQYAIQGKLVPQDPKDEPASELLKRIHAERERLVKEGKLKKEKPLPSISEEEIPFAIPKSWNFVKLWDLLLFHIGGGTPSKKETKYWNGTIPWASVKDLPLDKLYLDKTEDYITEDGLKNSSSNIIPAGTVIICQRMGLGKIVINTLDVAINQDLRGLFFSNYVNKIFILYVIKALKITGHGQTVKGISIDELKTMNVPLPPLAEQKRIVAKIEELMPLVEAYGKAEERLTVLNEEFPEKLRKSILQQAVQGKLTQRDPKDEPASELLKRIRAEKAKLIADGKIRKEKPLSPISEEEIPFEIPETWEWCHLADCLDVRDGTHDSPRYVTDGYPLVTSKNLKNGKIDLTDVKFISQTDFNAINIRSGVDKDDILFAMIGSIGNPSVIGEEHSFAIKNVALFKGIKPFYCCKYLFYYLLYLQDNFRRKASGGVQPFVSLNFLRGNLIPLPPLAEQQRIVERVEELLQICHHINKSPEEA